MNEQTVVGTAARFFANGWVASLSAGAILDGSLDGRGAPYEIYPGWLLSLRGGVEAVAERGAVPFVHVDLALTVSRALAHERGGATTVLWASDVQISAAVGYTLFDRWRLYLAPRAFGGPIFMERGGETVRGRDRYFFMAGIGTAVLLPAGLTVFVDGSPLGERAISAGIAAGF